MAILRRDSREVEVADGESILEACKELGVQFGCYMGVCGICKITVVSGAENLGEPTEQEVSADLAEHERLACQCKIKSGTAEFTA